MSVVIGQIVTYTLTEDDAAAINARRADATRNMDRHQAQAQGVLVHVGNTAYQGDRYPMLVVRTWGEDDTSAVNGQVFLDGNDTLWVTSVTPGPGERHFAA